MALPADGQDANGLTKVTEIPAGKELIFFDPTTNEGGIITLENLTKQILNGLASQTFALDAGQQTILQALNNLNGDSLRLEIKNTDYETNTTFDEIYNKQKQKQGNVGVYIFMFSNVSNYSPLITGCAIMVWNNVFSIAARCILFDGTSIYTINVG